MKTIKYNTLGILGNPLRQSLSPTLHNYWINQNKLEYDYCKFELECLDNIDKAIRKLKLKGLNVTIPFKKEIIKYLDEIDKTAQKLQAVNTIKNNNGILKGYNTDVSGFISGLNSLSNLNKEKPAVILGAGGACESVIYSLIRKGLKHIFLMNRTVEKAKLLKKKYKEVTVIKWLEKDILQFAGLIVNCTSLGMVGYPNLPISLKKVGKDTKIYDIVYNPLETKLIREAKKNKLEYVTGLPMFLGQAKKSFEIWFGITPKINNYIISKIKKKIENK